jgi:proline iminopeptidase
MIMKAVYRFISVLVMCMGIFNIVNAQDITPEFEGLKDINGTQIYCKVIGKGEPLLIIHGGPSLSHDYLEPHLRPLAKNYRLIFFDHRAAGRSAIPDTNDVSHQAFIEDINGVMNAFKIDSANILAHSWGCKLAVLYALENQQRVRKMILSNPVIMSHEFDSAQNALLAKKANPGDKMEMRALSKTEGFANGDPKVFEKLMMLNFRSAFYDTANISKLQLSLPANFKDGSMVTWKGLSSDMRNYDKDYFPELNNIKSPVLIIHGMADNVVIQADEKMQRSLAHGHLSRFNRSGHFPFVEENDQFIKVVKEFLADKK